MSLEKDTQKTTWNKLFIENLREKKKASTAESLHPLKGKSLILLFVITTSSTTLGLLGVLSLHAARATATVWRAEREINVLLAVQPHHKGGDVHNLLAHPAEEQQKN